MIGVGVHIYMCVCMFVDKNNNLNRTLAIDSPFQTFAVGLLIEVIDLALPLLSPEVRQVEQGFSYIMCTLLYLSEG